MRRLEIGRPSSSPYCVTCLAAKLGASAIQRLRTPLALNTQAILPLRFAATRFEGNGELITCSRVKFAAEHGREIRETSRDATANHRCEIFIGSESLLYFFAACQDQRSLSSEETQSSVLLISSTTKDTTLHKGLSPNLDYSRSV